MGCAVSAVIDPDLEKAIVELRFAEDRIRQIEAILEDSDHHKRYPDLARMLAERADLAATIRTRAETLKVDPRGLRLMIRLADKVRSRARGRATVNLDKLLTVVTDAAEIARIDRAEAHADLLAVEERLKSAKARATGLASAADYLERCRG